MLTYVDIAAPPETSDLAVIATPPETVPAIIDALGKRAPRAAVIVRDGFGEGGEAPAKALRQAVLDTARPYLLRVIRPNGFGVLLSGDGHDASFARLNPAKGTPSAQSMPIRLAPRIRLWHDGSHCSCHSFRRSHDTRFTRS